MTKQSQSSRAPSGEWVKFRDAESDFESDQFRGGSILPMMHLRCPPA